MANIPDTRQSLIARMCDQRDAVAWSEFVEKYTGLIFGYSRKYVRNNQDAEDVSQNVLAALHSDLPKYDRTKPFRSWLFGVIRNQLFNYKRNNAKKPCAPGGTDAWNTLQQIPDDSREAVAEWELEYKLHILKLAAQKFDHTTKQFQAFWLTRVEGRGDAAVAKELDISIGALHVYRSRTIKAIRVKIDEIDSV